MKNICKFQSSNWFNKNKTSFEGNTIDNITSQLELHQLINEPTQNSPSCIDLIFTFQSNLVIESGVPSSFHSRCYLQIAFPKFNLKICYPPPY